MPAIFILFAMVVIAVIIFTAIHGHRAQKERELELHQLSLELAWSFDASRDHTHDDRFGQFGIFTTGQSRYAYNTLRGSIVVDEQQWTAQMGDYHYTTTSGSGKNRRTTPHHLSYLLVDTPYDGAPDLKIRREHMFDRMASFVGFDDIDFESAEFSDKFHVKSSDKRFAYDVIDPRMMEFLLAETPPTIHFEQGVCCIYYSDKRWSATDFLAQKSWLEKFISHWPRHVTTSLQS